MNYTIIANPSAFGNTTLHCPQSITTWLLTNQSIPRITSNPSIGKQMRFTLNLRPATSIRHPTQTDVVDTSPDAGVATIKLHASSCITRPTLLTHSLDTNEWVQYHNLVIKHKQVVCTKLPDWAASVVVKANTRPDALGHSPIGFFVGALSIGFLLG